MRKSRQIIHCKVNRRTSYAIKQLSDDQGFVMNMTPAREDGKAREACETFFGKTLVDNITAHLHRSVLNYDSLIEDLLDYDRVHVKKSSFDKDALAIYNMAVQSIKDDLGTVKLAPLTFEEVRHRPDFPGSKSPGLPYKLMGVASKREVFDDNTLMDAVKNNWSEIAQGKNVKLPDVCLFARAQMATAGKEKVRATWGYSFDVYIEEARYFYPILDYIKERKHNFPIAYGLEMAKGGMIAINDLLTRNPHCKYVVSDWSKFDKTIPVWLIRDAFSILAEIIDFSVGREDHNRRRFKKLIDYFCETPIRTCKGERFLVTGGVPSGSCFTNLIDSIINCLVTRFLFYQTTGRFPVGEIFLGDDSVTVIDGHACLEDIASLAIKFFGMVLNIDKSYVTTNTRNVHFLGYFNYYGTPFKSQDVLIASFIFPEHRRSKLIDACAAALGQMYSGFDPGYAVTWYNIIKRLASQETKEGFLGEDILIHLRKNEFRHKYLQQIGVYSESMSVPKEEDSLILAVLPAYQCEHALNNRYYDYNDLYKRS